MVNTKSSPRNHSRRPLLGALGINKPRRTRTPTPPPPAGLDDDASVQMPTMPGARKDLKARFDAETPKSRLRRIGSAIGRGMGMTPSMSSASGASLRHSETGVGNFGNALPLAYRPQTRWSQSNGSTRSWPRRDEDEAICPRRRRRTLPSNTSEEAEGPISWLVVDNDFAGFTQPDFDPESERQREAKEREQDAEIDRAMALADIESVSYSDGTSSRLRKPAGRIRRAKRFAARAWRYFYGFADSSFNNEQTEQAFQRETWSNGKTAALCSSLYLLIQYILWVGLTPSSTIRGKLTYIMGCGICSIPLPFMVLFDGQRRFKWIYQVWVASCAWIWGYILTNQMYRCGYFGPNPTCNNSSFLSLFSSLVAFPTIAIVNLSQNRLLHLAMSFTYTIISAVWFHGPVTPRGLWRNDTIVQLYHILLVFNSYFRERSDRQSFMLRSELKTQYRAVQSAQDQERRAEESKKRFVSYIFHEVRVPLNTARLAVTNLDGEGAFAPMSEDQKDMILGLDGSLRMMEKVLNDVLSFNRMESGNLILARKPFDVHKAIHYVALAHRAIAEVSGLDFELELDWRLDTIGGTVIGDEMRFKQVCSNLVSNAFKFTSEGGVRIVTKLLYPEIDAPAAGPVVEKIVGDGADTIGHNGVASKASSDDTESSYDEKKRTHRDDRGTHVLVEPEPSSPLIPPGSPHVSYLPLPAFSKAVIRVEVHDTGAGISPGDVAGNRLFSPYVQTEIGRRQGGKGSGLGLALVMQIVKLSHGRLGVDSEKGKGSIFWFELPYSIPPPEARPPPRTNHPPEYAPSESPDRISDSEDPNPVALETAPMTISSSAHSVIGNAGEERRARSHRRSSGSRRAPPVAFNAPFAPAGTLNTGSILPPDTETELVESDLLFGPISPITGLVSLPSSPMSSPPVSPLSVPPGTRTDRNGSGMPGFATEMAGASIDPLQPVKAQQLYPSPPILKRVHTSPVLPASPTVGTSTLPTDVEPSETPPHPLEVLVVDDDPLTRKLMSRMLTRLGNRVTTAENGAVGLAHIVESWKTDSGPDHRPPRVDVVFLDNQMPLMSGVEVARELRRLDIGVYIVGCTGNALREDQDEYLIAGADDILPKPVAQNDVIQKLEEARRRKAQA